eukprot:CAMPEP_0168192902 /NCGR_PEP_ID=MMETSP0139_2-20121125/18301_1 /TAXON_ID=44445 /ORGANISM="Pseudo-nitzschia australis, Strain 10249 10 AB" /LENGTH=108 /DNA_ID=CAMNT_0008116183 /DNA_START=133 /DNA_END=459 /DNA_ORIENTATION=+
MVLVNTGHAFQAQLRVPDRRTAPTELFGKRAKIAKTVKNIFGNDGAEGEAPVAAAAAAVETESKPSSGKKVKLSNGRAKDLAKKYKEIDDIGERAFQILVDLKMVGKP